MSGERVYEPGLSDLIHPDEALVVLGSLNAHPQDRKLDRSEVRPLQVLLADGRYPAAAFDLWGKFGVSSVAWHPERPEVLYFVTDSDAETGDELFKADLLEGRIVKLTAPGIRDAHEIAVVGETLWVANTATDEAVAFDLARERVTRRVRLSVRGATPKVTVHADSNDGRPETVDKFHCNQVFQGLDGDLYALVHYAAGKQLLRRAANKLVKRQGNGGVINLSNGIANPLGLKQPHSVRVVGDGYWVLDSGRSAINVYDRNWMLQGRIPSQGWGRGAGISNKLGLFYAGISEIRERYLDLIPYSQRAPNMLQPISIGTRESAGRIPLSNLEQVNDIRVLPKERALALLNLR